MAKSNEKRKRPAKASVKAVIECFKSALYSKEIENGRKAYGKVNN